MRRLPAILVVAAIGLCLPGCSLFKKNTGGGGGGDTPNQLPPPKFPTADSKADPLSGQSRNSGGSGLLAGRVLDGTSRPPAGTSLLIVRADAKDDSAGNETKVDGQGYFTIENLDRGGKYKLIARGKQGDRAVAGTHYATAPNVHVLIQMKEELVSSITPAVQGPYSTLNDDKKFEPLSPQQPSKEVPTSSWQPNEGVKVAGAELVLPPVQVGVQPSNDFTQGSGGLHIPPTLEMSPKKASIPNVSKVVPADIPQRADVPVNLGSTKVPSCARVGQQITSFALNDINGEPWEYKPGNDRKGKIVLVDFWATYCKPCKKSLPYLRDLQNRFGNHGFEVIGIVCEEGEQLDLAYKVKDVFKASSLESNYRQLLGGGDGRIVSSTFRVRGFPTLFLLNEQGRIVWYHEGELELTKQGELARLIESQLSRMAANLIRVPGS